MNIIVVGGGIVGCAIAHELASRGARVVVVDPRGTGQGATRASAGMLAPYIEGHVPELRELCVRSLSLYDGFIDRLRAETDQPIEYERTGTLQVARGDAEAERLREDAARLSSEGVDAALLGRGDVLRLVRPPIAADLSAGLLIRQHGYVVVQALVDGLVASAQKAGALFTSERVMGVQNTDSGARVATMDRTIDGDAVVIAAGSWTNEIPAATDWSADVPPPSMPPPVKPIRGQLLRVRISERLAPQVLWGSGC